MNARRSWVRPTLLSLSLMRLPPRAQARTVPFSAKLSQLGPRNENGALASIVEPTEHYYIYNLMGPPDTDAGRFVTIRVFEKMINDTLSPPGDLEEAHKQRVPQGAFITMVYYDETPGTIYLAPGATCLPTLSCDSTDISSNWAFLDGFAIGIAKFGERSNDEGDFLGGSRRLSLWAIYHDGSMIRDPTRDRTEVDAVGTPGGFMQQTDQHIFNGSPSYYHPLPDNVGTIYICMESGQGTEKAFVRVGSIKGSLSAEVERDSTKAEIHCPDL